MLAHDFRRDQWNYLLHWIQNPINTWNSFRSAKSLLSHSRWIPKSRNTWNSFRSAKSTISLAMNTEAEKYMEFIQIGKVYYLTLDEYRSREIHGIHSDRQSLLSQSRWIQKPRNTWNSFRAAKSTISLAMNTEAEKYLELIQIGKVYYLTSCGLKFAFFLKWPEAS